MHISLSGTAAQEEPVSVTIAEARQCIAQCPTFCKGYLECLNITIRFPVKATPSGEALKLVCGCISRESFRLFDIVALANACAQISERLSKVQRSHSLARLEPGRLNDSSCLVCALGVLAQSLAVGIWVIKGEGGI